LRTDENMRSEADTACPWGALKPEVPIS